MKTFSSVIPISWEVFFFSYYLFILVQKSNMKITSIKSIESMQYKTIENRNGNLWISHIRMLHIQRNWKVIIFFVWLLIRDCILMPVSSIQKEIFIRGKRKYVFGIEVHHGAENRNRRNKIFERHAFYFKLYGTCEGELKCKYWISICMNIETPWLLWIIRKHRHKQKKLYLDWKINSNDLLSDILHKLYVWKELYFFCVKTFSIVISVIGKSRWFQSIIL